MKKIAFVVPIFLLSFIFSIFHIEKDWDIDQDTAVWEVLKALGEPMPNHQVNTQMEGVSIEKGRSLVLYGHPDSDGKKKVQRQSKHFVCTSCHNIEKELADLSITDPQVRLEYARDHQLPFLQGSALHGAVNRTEFYNGDYEKKYGDLVKAARNSLRESIQLCAVECSQGRPLKDWELESVLAYLWTLELTLADLNLSETEMQKLATTLNQKQQDKPEMIALIKSRYLSGIPAHFVAPPEDRKKGYGLKGDPENGELIYELSCLHCHEQKRYSLFELDRSKLTMRYLDRHFSRYSHASIYQVSRYGAPSLYGKRAYMPQYTQEKMSNQQMEDLRAYIHQAAQ
ncbi:MAG: c-type cytochrome [Bacteroidota bacterium]